MVDTFTKKQFLVGRARSLIPGPVGKKTQNSDSLSRPDSSLLPPFPDSVSRDAVAFLSKRRGMHI